VAAQPSPVIALNRAIAVGFRDGYQAGLPAAGADFLRRLGHRDKARRAYLEALELAPAGQPERRLLQRRLSEL
jgi:RNA polymerase sigma-70 factor, ECF subfamily